jgi:uncharacterized protein
MAGCADRLVGWRQAFREDDFGGKAGRGSGFLRELKQPKVYAFDTGFVSYAWGWEPLRSEDYGILWEHLVLEHLQAHFADTPPRYWRDKAGHEVDFILVHRRDQVDVIECKWDPDAFDGRSLKIFRSYYPHGCNYLVTPGGDPAYVRRVGELEVKVCTPTDLRP